MKKIALVTGGSRGIGWGIVHQLATQGFDLAINGVRPVEAVQDVLERVRALGVEAMYCQGNVALSADRKKIMHEVNAHFGQLNILVNNAGIAPRERRDVLQTSEESFDEVLDTNLKSCYFLTQDAANWMIQQKTSQPDFFACIINVSSISATVASVNRGEYCVSKAGISMVTQLFAARLGEFNIPVYEIRPGVISTDMTTGVKEKYDLLIAQGLCVQPRWGTPEDVGQVVGALAAGHFPYSSGQVFMVDGGLTLPRL
jgi:NAD(P)-dependent dehydrogenase (short-subunit alcohol dehydrogenase family)